MEKFKRHAMRRMCSDAHLNSTDTFSLDDLVFKSPGFGFTPKKKRKRHRTEDDTVSLQSVDINIEDDDESKKRRLSSMVRMGSLVNLISPMKKKSSNLKKSYSLKSLVLSPIKSDKIASSSSMPYKVPVSTPSKRNSLLWSDTASNDALRRLNAKQIERQEAVHEIYRNEQELIDDINMIETTYHQSMIQLGILTSEELDNIFGQISSLVPMHEDLVKRLDTKRQRDGTIDSVGNELLDWVPLLESYIPYCANQIYAKDVLDSKRLDPNVQDFLNRCQESPFSRRLDLWSFLDVPRSRLVKYPLLFKNLIKLSPPEHFDIIPIQNALNVVEDIIKKVDVKTGEAKCAFIKGKLTFLDDKQKKELIDESNVILVDGPLKTARGSKLHVFLFEKVLVLSRIIRRHSITYQVYRNPIPLSDLYLEEDASASVSSSFRNAFTSSANGKNMFRVYKSGGGKGYSHTLQANDEHDKQQWISLFKDVLPRDHYDTSTPVESSVTRESEIL